MSFWRRLLNSFSPPDTSRPALPDGMSQSAEAGIQPGIHGATDELGFHAIEHPHYVTDLHATVYRLLGLDARKLEVPGLDQLIALEGKHKALRHDNSRQAGSCIAALNET